MHSFGFVQFWHLCFFTICTAKVQHCGFVFLWLSQGSTYSIFEVSAQTQNTHFHLHKAQKIETHTEDNCGALCLQYYINAVDSWQAPTW